MNVVDWILVAAVVLFALAGWHRGFVASVLSFIGFIGGALAAAFLLPPLVDRITQVQAVRVGMVGLGILLCALLGQVVASIVGSSARRAISWTPVKALDNILGALVNVLALAIVVWIIASAIAFLPASAVSEQVSRSRLLSSMDAVVPPQARNLLGSLRDLLASTEVPRIFSGLVETNGPDVADPDPRAVSASVDDVRDSIVQVTGNAADCHASVAGSGWVFDRGRVATNAHVVAGVEDLQVRVHLGDSGLPATVVYFDPKTDIAVLDVPDLDAPAIPVDPTPLATEDDAVIAGFPESGPFHAEPARIRTKVSAVGDDIYGASGVQRDVYVLSGRVLPGDSGGPLLTPAGSAAGMVFGTAQDHEDIGYALTAESMAAALGTRSRDEVPTGDCRVRD